MTYHRTRADSYKAVISSSESPNRNMIGHTGVRALRITHVVIFCLENLSTKATDVLLLRTVTLCMRFG